MFSQKYVFYYLIIFYNPQCDISLKVVIYNYNIFCVIKIYKLWSFLYLKFEKNCDIDFIKLCHFIDILLQCFCQSMS